MQQTSCCQSKSMGKPLNYSDKEDYDEEDGEDFMSSWLYSDIYYHSHRGAWSGGPSEFISSRNIH